MTTAIEELTKLVNERMNDGGNTIAVKKELLVRVIGERAMDRFDLNAKRGWAQRRFLGVTDSLLRCATCGRERCVCAELRAL